MKDLWPRVVRGAVGTLVLFALVGTRPARGQKSAFVGAEESGTIASSPLVPGSPANEIVSKVMTENDRRKERLRGYKVVRTYQIKTLEGKLAAQTIVQMEYNAPDTKTFEKTAEKGSGVVRHLVFDRLMDSESETSTGKQRQDSALTPANYDFRFAGEEDLGPYHCLILEAIPKRKDKYLFEGKIWIDTQDYAVAKIEGHPAKKPSFWINRVDFVRLYQRIDGFWLPARDETSVDVKIYGRRIFTIDHQQYVIASTTPPQEVDGRMDTVEQ